jgi:hypothetical protein
VLEHSIKNGWEGGGDPTPDPQILTVPMRRLVPDPMTRVLGRRSDDCDGKQQIVADDLTAQLRHHQSKMQSCIRGRTIDGYPTTTFTVRPEGSVVAAVATSNLSDE